MAFQVRVRINARTIETLPVASSHEEFEKFTIRELKKILTLFPGVRDARRSRIIFFNNELEDDQTFESCNIEQMSVLIVVFKMSAGDTPDPGGTEAQRKVSEDVEVTDSNSPYEGLCRTDSMEKLPPNL